MKIVIVGHYFGQRLVVDEVVKRLIAAIEFFYFISGEGKRSFRTFRLHLLAIFDQRVKSAFCRNNVPQRDAQRPFGRGWLFFKHFSRDAQ